MDRIHPLPERSIDRLADSIVAKKTRHVFVVTIHLHAHELDAPECRTQLLESDKFVGARLVPTEECC